MSTHSKPEAARRVLMLAALVIAGCVRGYPMPVGQPEEVRLATVAVRPADYEDRYVSFVGTLTGETATGCEYATAGVVLATPEPSIVYLVLCLAPAAAQQVSQMPQGTRLHVAGTSREVATRYGARAFVYVTRIDPAGQ